MTKQEASERYSIPLELLNEYEKWGLCEAAKLIIGDCQYDDSDLQRMSLIMTLKDAGFKGVGFVPLSPSLELGSVLAWKKSQTFSSAVSRFLQFAQDYLSDR